MRANYKNKFHESTNSDKVSKSAVQMHLNDVLMLNNGLEKI